MSRSWICACGRKNDLDEGFCRYCGDTSTVVGKVPKPLKRAPIKKVSKKQTSIKRELQEAYAYKATLTANQMHCDGCESTYWDDRDHTISQKRCKDIGKPELIWNVDNIEYSCRECHMAWESYKSGEFRHHKNFERRMAFMKEHDYEGYVKRMEVVELFNRPKQTV